MKDSSFKIIVGVTLLWLLVSARRSHHDERAELTASLFNSLQPMESNPVQVVPKPSTALRHYAPLAMDSLNPDVVHVRRDHSSLDEILKLLNGGPKQYLRFSDIIQQAAATHSLDPDLIRAVIMVESGFHVKAESNKGARGLMQLMPGTARDMGVTNLYNPSQNINGGSRYLRHLLDRFNNNIKLALAGYNAGPGAVSKFGGVPPYRETRDYVKKVLTSYRLLKKKNSRFALAERDLF